MNYEDYQRALLALSFDEAPSQGALPEFALYRSMIRGRVFEMARVAFKRSWTLLGHDRCTAAWAGYLAARPPASPLIREAISTYGECMADDRALLAEAPPWSSDLVRFEAAKWRVGSAPVAPAPNDLRELDFAGTLVLNPTLELLPLHYEVFADAEPGPAFGHTLLVYRRPGADDVRWYRAELVVAALLTSAQRAPSSLAQLVPSTFASLREPIDAASAHALSSALATAVERGVVLGVRDGAS